MMKASDSAFEAAKSAYMGSGWLLQEVAKEVGWEKTIAIYAVAGGKFAALLGGMVRTKCGEQKVDAACISAVLVEAYKNVGIDFEVQARNGGVTVQVERCPIYEGLAASGIDHATIQKLCQGMTGGRFERLHELVPELKRKIKFRESASSACLEEFALAK